MTDMEQRVKEACFRLEDAAHDSNNGRVPISKMEKVAGTLWEASGGIGHYEREDGSRSEDWRTTLLMEFASLGGRQSVGARAILRGVAAAKDAEGTG